MLIRHLWQLKPVVFLHRCLIHVVLFPELKLPHSVFKLYICSKIQSVRYPMPRILVSIPRDKINLAFKLKLFDVNGCDVAFFEVHFASVNAS